MRELAERIHRGRKAIAVAKRKGMDTTEWEDHLRVLFAEAGREPGPEEGRDPWMLWEWRRVSIPDWRCILENAVETEDKGRERYARWMLREILLDPEYLEPEP